MSGITTCSREPSGSVASTNGEDRSTRRPEDFSIRSTRSRTWSAVSKVLVSSAVPPRATNTLLGSLIQISSTVGSSRKRLQRPEPGDGVEHALGRTAQIRERRQPAVQGALVVVRDRVPDQLPDRALVLQWVDTGAPDQLADLTDNGFDRTHGTPPDQSPTPSTPAAPTSHRPGNVPAE